MPRVFTQLTPFLWVVQSRQFNYNSGIAISGGEALLIDPGVFPDEIAEIRQFVADSGVALTSIILTHSHWDHILGPERLPGVRVIMQREAANASPEQRAGTIQEIERWEEENGVERDKPFVLPHQDETFEHDIVVRLSQLELRLIHAPGHWPDEIVVYHQETGTLWAGDMLSDIEVPYVSHSLAAYGQTLAMLERLDIRVLVPGHGRPTDDMDEIRRRLVEDSTYLAELRRKVLEWIEGGELPEMRKSLIVPGFTPSRKLDANLYPHSLNLQTVWQELGGKLEGRAGWGSS
jgi:hydroxyacylglutathione hydrolase